MIDIFNLPMDQTICPETGLSIIRQPDWLNVAFSPTYQLSYAILGKNILLIQTDGFGTLNDLQNGMRLKNQIIEENIPPDMPIIFIEDSTRNKGVSDEARSCYIDHIKSNRNLLGLVFSGVSPFLRMSIDSPG
jgi:hypothetical protein